MLRRNIIKLSTENSRFSSLLLISRFHIKFCVEPTSNFYKMSIIRSIIISGLFTPVIFTKSENHNKPSRVVREDAVVCVSSRNDVEIDFSTTPKTRVHTEWRAIASKPCVARTEYAPYSLSLRVASGWIRGMFLTKMLSSHRNARWVAPVPLMFLARS